MRENLEANSKNRSRKSKTKRKGIEGDDDQGAPEDNESESAISGDDAPGEYEQMLQKYEAEVRNHIKIEQQLKLHIECVQDKLEDQEKLLKKEVAVKEKVSSESELELKRYKDLLSLREKEISGLKDQMDQLRSNDESLKKRVDELEKDKVELNG